MPFFWRIFLSAWVIVLITVTLTLWAAKWLPDPGPDSDDAGFAEQMVTLIARDLRVRLATDPATAVDVLAKEHTLDFAPLLQVYVLDPGGNDVLGRDLPRPVAQLLRTRNDPSERLASRERSRLLIRDEALAGYLVVGYEGYFPMGRALLKPGARWLFFAFALIVSVIVSLMLARFIVLPVRRLQSAGQQVADGDLSVRVAHTVGSRTDDIARLAHEFDVMTERVDDLLESRHRLLRDVSHELRSPLARLQALLSIARQKADAAGAEQVDRMEAELARLDELIGEILSYSRLEAREGITRHPTDIVDLVQNIVDDASLEGQAAGKQIRMQGPQRCVIDLDSGLVQSAVENVVRNALRYTAEGTPVDVNILDDPECVRIVVDDHGPGVPEEAIAKIFEPFYGVGDSRSTQSGSGGIGLAIAERSIRLHGGTIAARNRNGGGLRVEIALPG